MEKIIRFGISVIDFDPEGRRRPVDRSGVHAVRGDRRYVFFCGERSVRKRSERLRTEVSINRFDRRRRLLVRGVTMRIRGLRTVRMQNACVRPQRGFRFRRTCISPRPAFRRVAVCLTGWLFCRHYPTMPPDPSEIGSGAKLRVSMNVRCRSRGFPEFRSNRIRRASGKRRPPFWSGLRFGSVGTEALEPIHSRNIIKLQITDNHTQFGIHSKSKSF